jgi:hypothetical protein
MYGVRRLPARVLSAGSPDETANSLFLIPADSRENCEHKLPPRGRWTFPTLFPSLAMTQLPPEAKGKKFIVADKKQLKNLPPAPRRLRARICWSG